MCPIHELVEDQNVTKDLEPLASGLVKKFDRLQVLSKKDLNESSNNLKNLNFFKATGNVSELQLVKPMSLNFSFR